MSTTDRRARRATLTKLALAAVAVLGVGAALTSAAWTDDAWFSAAATAGEVELEGRPVAVPPEPEFAFEAGLSSRLRGTGAARGASR